MKHKTFMIVVILSIFGIIDTSYLLYEHFAKIVPPCSVNLSFIDCGEVLNSVYSQIAGIPVSLFGLIYYSFILGFSLSWLKLRSIRVMKILSLLSTCGFSVSLFLMYVQLFIIGKVCLYCTLSAILSIGIFLIIQVAGVFQKRLTCLSSGVKSSG